MKKTSMTRTTVLLWALVLVVLILSIGAGAGEHKLSDTAAVPLNYQGEDYAVRLYPDAPLPEDAALSAREIEDASYRVKAAEQLGLAENEITFLRVFDLSILSGDQPIEPEGSVRVEMELATSGENIAALHFVTAPAAQTPNGRRLLKAAPKNQVETLETEVAGGTIQFTTGSFSAFAIVGYTLQKRVLASDGNRYLVTVAYDARAGLPENADLDVTELTQGSDAGGAATEYDRYVEEAERALGVASGALRDRKSVV